MYIVMMGNVFIELNCSSIQQFEVEQGTVIFLIYKGSSYYLVNFKMFFY